MRVILFDVVQVREGRGKTAAGAARNKTAATESKQAALDNGGQNGLQRHAGDVGAGTKNRQDAGAGGHENSRATVNRASGGGHAHTENAGRLALKEPAAVSGTGSGRTRRAAVRYAYSRLTKSSSYGREAGQRSGRRSGRAGSRSWPRGHKVPGGELVPFQRKGLILARLPSVNEFERCSIRRYPAPSHNRLQTGRVRGGCRCR